MKMVKIYAEGWYTIIRQSQSQNKNCSVKLSLAKQEHKNLESVAYQHELKVIKKRHRKRLARTLH